jgi:hypothetical protein
MRRSIFLAGSLMIIAGFMLYQFGFSSELNQSTLLWTWLTKLAKPVVHYGLSLELIALILQFSGGLLLLFGLVICFAGVASSKMIQFAGGHIEHSRKAPARIISSCRFCGAGFKDSSTFCSACGRSQV